MRRTLICLLTCALLPGCSLALDTDGAPCGEDVECDPGQRCDRSQTPAVCVIGESCDACMPEGQRECDGDSIMLCTADDQGCLDWLQETDCDAQGERCLAGEGDPSCEPLCPDVCEPGQGRCNGAWIQDCVEVPDGCPDWFDITDCSQDADGPYCGDDGDGDPICYANCTPECTDGESMCSGTWIMVCDDPDGCLRFQQTVNCADNGKVCEQTGPVADCVDQCSDQCTEGHWRCELGVRQNCVLLGECLVWRDTPCPVCQECNPGGADRCVMVGDGEDPRDECEPSQWSVCRDGHCDGNGACRQASVGTRCAVPAELCQLDMQCDDQGVCIPGPPGWDGYLCSLDTGDPDFWYDVCSGGACVSPGTCLGAVPDCNVRTLFGPLPDTSGVSNYTEDAAGVDEWVRDNVSALSWTRCPATASGDDCVTDQAPLEEMDWPTAVQYCDGLSFGGFDDWYLPDVFELLGLVDFAQVGPAINQARFPWVTDEVFWTSTRGVNAESAFAVSFYSGFTSIVPTDETGVYVRCVRRDGVLIHDTRFRREVPVADQPVVFDEVTGRTWRGCMQGQTGDACEGGPTAVNFNAAETACGSTTYADESDWRIPEVKELTSLWMVDRVPPYVDNGIFPRLGGLTTDFFWTATRRPDLPDELWVLNWFGQSDRRADTIATARLLCVRGPD